MRAAAARVEDILTSAYRDWWTNKVIDQVLDNQRQGGVVHDRPENSGRIARLNSSSHRSRNEIVERVERIRSGMMDRKRATTLLLWLFRKVTTAREEEGLSSAEGGEEK